MERKTIKFRSYLADMIIAGEKDNTWRLFDDKNLSKGDHVDLINWNTKEKFAEAILENVYEKTFGELTELDFDGHESFSSREDMFAKYSLYYQRPVDDSSPVKVIKFKLV